MSQEAGREKKQSAIEHHKHGRHDEAADFYIETAYEYLGEYGLKHAKSSARGLHQLGLASACLRHIGRTEECRSLCWQGVYISKVIGERVITKPRSSYDYDQAKRGVWFEFAGDFKLVGDLPEKEDAYDRAREVYVNAGNPERGVEQIPVLATLLTKSVVRGTGMDTEEMEALDQEPINQFTKWLKFKQRRLPMALERLDEQESWTYVA